MMNYFLLKSILIPVFGLSGFNRAEMNQLFLPENHNSVYHAEKTEQSNYKAGVRFISREGDCWKMQVNVYETVKGGTVFLRHSAIIETGKGSKANGKILAVQPDGIINDPEYILEDTLADLNGPIEVFFAKHPDVYMEVVTEKNNIIAKRK